MSRRAALAAIVALLSGPRLAGATEAATQDIALSLYRSGHYAASAHIYEQLVKREPDSIPLLKDLMWVCWSAEQPARAAAIATRLIQLAPDEVEVWALLAKAQYALSDRDGVLASARRLLELAPDNLHIQLDVAHYYTNLKEYAAAEELLRDMARQFPDELEVLVRLARVESLRGKFQAAAGHWASVVERAPEPAHRYQLAAALYYGGRQQDAFLILQSLLDDPDERRRALDLLSDDALGHGDYSGAAALLERHLTDLTIEDESRLLKLAQIYLDLQQYPQSLAALQRCLHLYPRSSKALMMQAYVTTAQGRFSRAVLLYRRILKRNPYSTDALLKLAYAYRARGHMTRARQLLGHARRIDPTNPYLLIKDAEYADAAGDETKARKLLQGWLRANRERAVPILLYHGLAANARDPMLAAPIHIPTAVFADHMRALHEAGWTPITAEQLVAWHRGHGHLPERPILISFDDARIDSFTEADPILARYGFKATMFAPLANVEGDLPGYASWHQLDAFRRTGRWEIQAHGDRGHNQIPLDAEGHHALFLPYRQWLAAEARLETSEEWRRRILDDHRSAQQKFDAALHLRPVAFAFPEGDFGQLGVPNDPESVPANLKAVREVFQVALCQNDFGFNVRSMDPMLLARVEPRRSWTGADLVRHLSDQSPAIQMRVRLLQWAVEAGRVREAKQWHEQLRQAGASEAVLAMERARILAQAGQHAQADALAKQSQEQGAVREAQPFRDNVRMKQRLGWLPSVEFFHDNKGRQHIDIRQTLESGRKAGTAWGPVHSWGIYSQDGVDTIMQHGLGLELSHQLNEFQRVELEVLGYLYSGDVAPGFTAGATFQSQWTDTFTTELSAGQEPLPTAQALAEEIADRAVDLKAGWNPDGPLAMMGESYLSFPTDDNTRYGGNVELSSDIGWVAGLKTVYRFSAEDSRQVTSAYYTPKHLMTHQLGLEYPVNLSDTMALTLRYLPGFGTDSNSGAGLVHLGQVRLPINWKEHTKLLLGIQWERVPSYTGADYEISLEHRF